MFGLEIIEVAIGLVFTYLVLSMVCSGIFEVWSRITRLRARCLEDGLRKMVGDEATVKAIYDHYLIRPLLVKEVGKPERIEAADFAKAVLDHLAPDAEGEARVTALKKAVESLTDDSLKKRMRSVLAEGERRLESAQQMVESWFDNSMEAVTLWYRKRAQIWVLLCSIAVTVAFNADSLRLARTLWNDDALRSSMAALADSYAVELEQQRLESPAGEESFRESVAALQSSINDAKTLPVGWSTEVLPGQAGYSGPHPAWFVAMKLLGLLLTIGAVSMGSSYWYKVLRKLLELASRRREEGGGGQTIIVQPAGGGTRPAAGTT